MDKVLKVNIIFLAKFKEIFSYLFAVPCSPFFLKLYNIYY